MIVVRVRRGFYVVYSRACVCLRTDNLGSNPDPMIVSMHRENVPPYFLARAEYQFLFSDTDDATDAFQDDGIWAYTVGLGYNFWAGLKR